MCSCGPATWQQFCPDLPALINVVLEEIGASFAGYFALPMRVLRNWDGRRAHTFGVNRSFGAFFPLDIPIFV